MSEWRDIASAPENEWILVCGDPWDAESPPMAVARYKNVTDEWWERNSKTTKKLVSETAREWDGCWSSPDAWQPLPPAPLSEDEHLRHCVKLGMIAVDAIRNPEWDLRECDQRDYENNLTMLKILADAFVKLAKRQDMMPTFRVRLPAAGEHP